MLKGKPTSWTRGRVWDVVKGKTDIAKGKGKMDLVEGKANMAEKVDTPNELEVEIGEGLPLSFEGLLDTLPLDRDGIWEFLMNVPEEDWLSSMIELGKNTQSV